jgi:uncharacterized membrane protein
VLIVLAPYLMSIKQDFLASVIYIGFSHSCHQLPERSFFIFGYKMAVCQRCTAIYAGFLLMTLIYPLIRKIDGVKTPGKLLLVAALIPMGLDGGLQLIHVYQSNPIQRVVTGGIFGLVLPLYVIPVYNLLMYDFLGWLRIKNKKKD